MERFIKSVLWLAIIHVMALLFFSFFRLVEFVSLHSQIAHYDASSLGAFVRGVWFDNVIACYIMVLPLVVVLVSAIIGWSRHWFRRGVTIYFSVLYAIAFMPSAANTPYFAYFFKNINSSIFGWFGYTATTVGMLMEEKSWWLYIALYFIAITVFVFLLSVFMQSGFRQFQSCAPQERMWHVRFLRHCLWLFVSLAYAVAGDIIRSR